MANYTIETKPAFSVLGLGTILTGEYMEMGQQKSAFWDKINSDKLLDKLNGLNDNQYAVNEAINGEFHYYAGREVANNSEASTDQRLIEFPAGKYLVVKASADNQMDVYNALEGSAFAEVLPSLSDYAYVGGPNTSFITSKDDAGVHGEMLVPLVEK
ncbi:GyrI-like domain-containing protein [Companilactobacillus huachuanensis]|uniref:GyrI-like domain-containing protein n=1 Tax=Companilactobacillus huachuanensis TaxID=2559914 RepID=A0ABW1RQC9_9LACO|nr:GyrI-like domain-containing protein [Companilactobacillus huachuanensis]